MARIKIDLPNTFSFSTVIPIRITDLNYGGHVGNDTILSLIHEGRVQFLNYHGYAELNIEGSGLIMSDVAIEFKKELFYGTNIRISISALDFTKVSFDLVYKIEVDEKTTLIALAKTGMVYFDYKSKKITAIPDSVKSKLMS